MTPHTIRRPLPALRILLALILLTLPAVGHAQIRLAAYTLGAPVEANHAAMHLAATLGQPFVGVSNTGSLTLEAGFWFVEAAPQATPIEHDETDEVPSSVQLDGNYPNPFNPQTRIGYGVPQALHVRLVVYDALGRAVAVLVDRRQTAGRYAVVFEAEDRPSGVYFYRLEAGQTVKTGTMLLLK